MARVLIIATGSISLYKTPWVIRRLKQEGHSVQVILTPTAAKLMHPSLWEALTRRPTLVHSWQKGLSLAHIHWMDWADVVAVLPATANFINQLAWGFAHNVALTSWLAHDFQKPFLIFPAMNPRMWEHPTVQKSRHWLKNWQIIVLPPAYGELACGHTGSGHLLPVYAIWEAFQMALGNTSWPKSTEQKWVWITLGASHVPIDTVRVVVNKSSGQTGLNLALGALRAGYHVKLFAGQLCENQPLWLLLELYTQLHRLQIERFQNSRDLLGKLTHALSSSPPTIGHSFWHVAALNDFEFDYSNQKYSSQEVLTLRGQPAPKVIDQIYPLWKGLNPGPFIAFKLLDDWQPQNDRDNPHWSWDNRADFWILNQGRHLEQQPRVYWVWANAQKRWISQKVPLHQAIQAILGGMV